MPAMGSRSRLAAVQHGSADRPTTDIRQIAGVSMRFPQTGHLCKALQFRCPNENMRKVTTFAASPMA